MSLLLTRAGSGAAGSGALPASVLVADAITTWTPTPQAQYDAATGRTILGLLKPDATKHVYSYDHETLRLWSRPSGFIVDTDDQHNTVSTIILRSDGSRPGQPLFAYAGHNGTLKFGGAYRPGRVGALRALSTEVLSNTATYPSLVQVNDTAKTAFCFYRNVTFGAPNQWDIRYTTSSNGGATWAAPVEWLNDESGTQEERPYLLYACEDGSSRIDFITTKGHWGEVSGNYLAHGYFQVAAGGTWTLHTSDGTEVGDIADIPFTPAQFTKIAGPEVGVANFAWVDLAYVQGVLTLIYTRMTPETSATEHVYYWTQLVAGAWTTPEEMVVAGGAQTIAGWHVPGGACLDENDAANAFVSLEMSAGNFQIFKIRRTVPGEWTLGANISGDTGNKNIFPIRIHNDPDSRILFVRGTYTNDTDWDTDILVYPGLPIEAAPTVVQEKPAAPVWDTDEGDRLYPGVKFFVPFTEGSGSTAEDFAPGVDYDGTLAGAAAWQVGDYGPQVGNFATLNDRVVHAYPAQPIATGVYPCYTVLVDEYTGTTQGDAFALGHNSSGTPWWRLQHNAGGAGDEGTHIRPSIGNGVGTNFADDNNDGAPRFYMQIWYSATEAAFFSAQLSGNAVVLTQYALSVLGTGLTTTTTLQNMTTGAGKFGASYSSPAVGVSAIMRAGGEGGAPDPLEIAEDLLLGVYAPLRG